jgi:hypothetical protein
MQSSVWRSYKTQEEGALGGFEPKRRMAEGENGGPTRRVEEEEGGLAIGKTSGRWRRAVLGRRAPGGSGREKTGEEEEKPLTGGAQLLCWQFKSNQTNPKQFK